MDEKKRQVVLNATKKLILSKTPDEEIRQSLKGVGLSDSEAENILSRAKSERETEAEIKEATEVKEEKPKNEVIVKKAGEKKLGILERIPKLKKEKFLELGRRITEGLKVEKGKLVELGKEVEEKIVAKKEEERGPSAMHGVLKRTKEKLAGLKKGMAEVLEVKKEAEIVPKEELEEIKKGIPAITPIEEMEEEKELAAKVILPKEGKTKIEKRKGKAGKRGKIKPKIEKPVKPLKEAKPLTRRRVAGKLTLLIIPNKEYLRSMVTLVKSIDKKYKRICYVSLNELFNNLTQNFERSAININKFFFIDAITKTTQTLIPPKKNCIFVTSPNSLIELSLAITEALEKQQPDVLLFDSLSTLLIYEKAGTVTKFIHSLIGKIRVIGSDCFLTALEGDTGSEAIRDLGMFVDEVLTMNEYELYKLRTGVEGKPIAREISKDQRLIETLKEFEAAKTRPIQIIAKPSIEGKVVREEMGKLKERLAAIEKKPATRKEIKRLEKKLEDIGEKRGIVYFPEALQEELRKISSRLKAVEKKRPKVTDSTPYIREELRKLSEKIEKVREKPRVKDATPLIRKELNKLSKKLAERKEKPATIRPVIVKADLKKLENKIAKLEEKPVLQKEIELLAKRIEKIKPAQAPKIDLGRVEQKIDAIEKRLMGEEKKARKREEVIEKRKKKVEKKKKKDQKQIELLEKKLTLLNKSYNLGIISEQAYLKDKSKIEALLKR